MRERLENGIRQCWIVDGGWDHGLDDEMMLVMVDLEWARWE